LGQASFQIQVHPDQTQVELAPVENSQQYHSYRRWLDYNRRACGTGGYSSSERYNSVATTLALSRLAKVSGAFGVAAPMLGSLQPGSTARCPGSRTTHQTLNKLVIRKEPRTFGRFSRFLIGLSGVPGSAAGPHPRNNRT